MYDPSIHPASGTPFKKCISAAESLASSTWPPGARLPKANDDELGQRARSPGAASRGLQARPRPECPPHTRPPPNSTRLLSASRKIKTRQSRPLGRTNNTGDIHGRAEDEKGGEESRRRLAASPGRVPGAVRCGAERPRTRARVAAAAATVAEVEWGRGGGC